MYRNIHTAHFWADTVTNLGPRICKLVPDEIKNASPLLVFKSRIKTWTTDNCPCRLCKTFVKYLDFIEVFPNLKWNPRLYLVKNYMFGIRSSHCWYCDNFLSGPTTRASEELVICSYIVLVATTVQLVVCVCVYFLPP